MKISSIAMNTGYLKGRAAEHSLSSGGMNAYYESAKKRLSNNEQINTTIGLNSNGRASFKGGVPLLHKAAEFTSKNPLVAEALFALLITCGLRPLTIMATAKTDEDKEKCSYQAAKSISSGVVGLAVTALIGTVIAAAAAAANGRGAFKMPEEMKQKSMEVVKKGVEALNKLKDELISSGKESELVNQITNVINGEASINLEIFKEAGKGAEENFIRKIEQTAPNASEAVARALKEQKILNNYPKTAKNVIDKMFQPIFMPIRANITVALVPTILGLLGLSKTGKKPKVKQPKEQPYNLLNYVTVQTDKEKELFQSFAGVANHENK